MANNFYADYPVTNGGVISLDGMTGALTLVAGSGISIVDGSSTITISATGGPFALTDLSNLANPTAVSQDLIFNTGGEATLKTADGFGVSSKSLDIASGGSTGFGTGDVNIFSGSSDVSTTGAVNLNTGNTGGGASGNISGSTGNVATSSNSGAVQFSTGQVVDGASGSLSLISGNAIGVGSSGSMFLTTGTSTNVGVTGDINLATGAPAGTGASGALSLITGDTAQDNSGSITINSGTSGNANSGQIIIESGPATVQTGPIIIQTGDSDTSNSGALSLITGNGTTIGNINLQTNDGSDVSISLGLGGALSAQTAAANSPMIIMDGTTPTFLSAYYGGILFKGNDALSEFIIMSEDLATSDVTSGLNMLSGVNTSTGGTGGISIGSGTAVSGTTGSVVLSTGATAGTRGHIQFIDGSQGTSGYVWTSIDVNGSGTWSAPTTLATNKKELIVLSGTDITNQYVDLSHVAKVDSIDFLVRGGGIQMEGASYEYSVNYTGGSGGNTRITFLNGIATGGPSALVNGDIIVAKYEY